MPILLKMFDLYLCLHAIFYFLEDRVFSLQKRDQYFYRMSRVSNLEAANLAYGGHQAVLKLRLEGTGFPYLCRITFISRKSKRN